MKPLRKRSDMPPSMDPSSPRFYDPDWQAWESPRRWPQITAVLLLAAVVLGLLVQTKFGESTTLTTHKPVTSTTFPLPGTGTGQIAPLSFSGNGSTTTTNFTVTGGVTIFEMTCTCAANFAVALRPTGQPVQVLLNQTRYFTGIQGLNLAHGVYSLNVAADLKWHIRVTQPRNETPITGLHDYTGTGPAVVGPFALSPTTPVRVVVTPTASTFESLTYLPADGGPATTPFAATGFVFKTIPAGVPKTGSYYVSIANGGYWALRFNA
ncbi:MAG: hypothetical protein WCL38_06975 [Actinomycetota bacterium]